MAGSLPDGAASSSPLYSGRLELTWTNKHKALLSDDAGNYQWVPPSDYRVAEVRLLRDAGRVGEVGPEKKRAQDNLLIRGDALNALTSLARLPEFKNELVGKVKLAYIDPPFNTQQSFLHYDDALEHSVWLTMMRDRLEQIKTLLDPERGSVWVHCDDSEMPYCRILMDEVFDRENFVAVVIWEKADSARNDATTLSTDHDYILIYAKSKDRWRPNRMARTAEMDAIYSSADGDGQLWFDDNPTAPGARTHQGMVYAVQSPFTGKLQYPARGRCWFADQDRMLAALNEWAPYERRDIGDADERARRCGVSEDDVREGVQALMVAVPLEQAQESAQSRYDLGNWPELIFRSKGRGGIGRKRYQPETGAAPRTLWLNAEVGHNRTAKAEIKALFPEAVPFATPKPERLLRKIVEIATDPGDLVLDCFLGSGTTAAVAHKMGRRWLGIEFSRETLDTFTAPRLKKVVEGSDLGGLTNAVGWEGGGGFRILDVAPSMFEEYGRRVLLAEWAIGGDLAEATAAQLGFAWEPDAPFSGRKGRMRLAVIDGLINPEIAQLVVGALPPDEKLTLCGTAIDERASESLQSLRPGSRVRKIPQSILQDYQQSGRWWRSSVPTASKEPGRAPA
jgi:adenine-specific DNA-methyltransferase